MLGVENQTSDGTKWEEERRHPQGNPAGERRESRPAGTGALSLWRSALQPPVPCLGGHGSGCEQGLQSIRPGLSYSTQTLGAGWSSWELGCLEWGHLRGDEQERDLLLVLRRVALQGACQGHCGELHPDRVGALRLAGAAGVRSSFWPLASPG